ncbi:MAG: aldehyde ferredoxin oxidoreductase family protein [Clostridia bacterium]|nr:aldehyde ferredoxin oxidoreductase family protein [Clostridia bacterium]
MHGFHNRLLRINLEAMDYAEEDLEDGLLREVLGGKGLGTYLLYKNAPIGVDPLSPNNPLIFAPGPVSDSIMPGGSRYGVFTKSPLTGFYAESYAGGNVAPAMKRTGYDAVVIEGAAKSPVFLEISHRGVRFHDASHLWGAETYHTQDLVLREVKQPQAEAIVIGPAGENLVRFACIENNYWRSAGRAGTGAVMGSKKLKAVVFWGEEHAPMADSTLLLSYVRELKKKGREDLGVKSYQKVGTPQLVAITNTRGCFPTRYWQQGQLEQWQEISGTTLVERYNVKSRSCKGCFMSCGKLLQIHDGPYKGLRIEGPEYETIYAFGGLCCITTLEAIAYLNDLCDRLGMDTISAGNLAALAIEACRRDRLALSLDYGDTEGIANLLRSASLRQGPGAVIADGIISASQAWRLEELAIHVKGLEPAGYDPRVLKGMALSYAVSPRGACHLRSTFYKLELSGMVPPETVENKAAKVIELENRLAIFDTLILCRFYRDLVSWTDLATIIEATTGMRFSQEELAGIAQKTIDLTRMFNTREGLKKEHDMIPDRLFAEPLGPHSLTREEFARMLAEYYECRGWSTDGMVLHQQDLRNLLKF